MADSVISELTDAPSGLFDLPISSSNASAPSYPPSSTDVPLVHRRRPRSTSESFLGHTFRYLGKEYRIKERSAAKKRGRQSYIWAHGAELFCKNNGHLSWLCVVYWDQGCTELYSASNTHHSGQHLRKAHYITGYGPAEAAEEEEEANSAKRSVLDQQIQGAQEKPSQRIVDTFLQLLIQWIVVAHIALSCVEQHCFQDLIQLLNPVLFV